MRLLIDILHPAHVHFFKNLYFELTGRGHEVLVTARSKDRSTELLDELHIPYRHISDEGKGKAGQAWEFGTRTLRFIRLAWQFRPDVLAGIMGPTIAAASRVVGAPAYVFYDTEFATGTNRWVYPLAARVITPDCYQGRAGVRQLVYPGYHELAYLHPKRFAPCADILRAADIDVGRPFFVVRFVAWKATHDVGEIGLTDERKIAVVRSLEKYGRVIVSSEGEVPGSLLGNLYRGPVESFHHLLAFSELYFGESATMASESAVLGTPAIYIAKTGRGYTDDQARYGLVHNFKHTECDAALHRAELLLQNLERTRREADANHQRLLADKIDVTEFMTDLFEADFPSNPGPFLK